MQSVETLTERLLYWLSLDVQVRALAERLLERFAVTLGDLPASAAHHHAETGGLYRHSKVGLLIEAFQEFIANGELSVNILSAQVYVEGGKAAVVVPVAISMARERLKARGITLPSNVRIFNMLRNAGLVDADQAGRSVRRIKVQGKQGTVSLSALIFPTEKVVPKLILSTLPPTHFEFTTEHGPDATVVAEE